MTPVDESAVVIDLARLDARDLNRGGGKAANLGELLRAGIPGSPRVRHHHSRVRDRSDEQ